jgi:hypothetical protein
VLLSGSRESQAVLTPRQVYATRRAASSILDMRKSRIPTIARRGAWRHRLGRCPQRTLTRAFNSGHTAIRIPRSDTPASDRCSGEDRRHARVRPKHPTLYFKSGCKQQPSPNARETRPPRGRVFRFARRDFEGWARAGGRRVSLSLNRRVARTPPLADRMGRKSLRVSPREGAGLRLGRARWSGHYPRGWERWSGAEPTRTATRR